MFLFCFYSKIIKYTDCCFWGMLLNNNIFIIALNTHCWRFQDWLLPTGCVVKNKAGQ